MTKIAVPQRVREAFLQALSDFSDSVVAEEVFKLAQKEDSSLDTILNKTIVECDMDSLDMLEIIVEIEGELEIHIDDEDEDKLKESKTFREFYEALAEIYDLQN